MEGDGFGDTLKCRKFKDALEKKTPHQGGAARPVLTAGTEPTKHSKVLRDFHPLSDILSPGLSRNVSLETISSCLRGGFSARKPWSRALGNPPALGQGPSGVIQRQVAAGTVDVRALMEAESAACLGSGVQTPCDPEQLRQPGVSFGERASVTDAGETSACLVLRLGGVRNSIVQFPPPSSPCRHRPIHAGSKSQFQSWKWSCLHRLQAAKHAWPRAGLNTATLPSQVVSPKLPEPDTPP